MYTVTLQCYILCSILFCFVSGQLGQIQTWIGQLQNQNSPWTCLREYIFELTVFCVTVCFVKLLLTILAQSLDHPSIVKLKLLMTYIYISSSSTQFILPDTCNPFPYMPLPECLYMICIHSVLENAWNIFKFKSPLCTFKPKPCKWDF